MGCWACGVGEIYMSLSSSHSLSTYALFPLTPSVPRCSTRHPAKKPASPSKSSILVTLDTSATAHHQHTPHTKKKTGEKRHPPLTKSKGEERGESKRLTLIRPHNNHSPCGPNSIPLVRMPVARVVVRVVDEDLVEVWGGRVR
jgi:hypothetical protein